MKFRVIGVALVGLALCGCSTGSWDRATRYVGLGPDDQTAPTAAQSDTPTALPPVAQESRSAIWCRQAAKADMEDAAANGFDAATQQHRAETSYRQCLGNATAQ
jgi:hypothetical protein